MNDHIWNINDFNKSVLQHWSVMMIWLEFVLDLQNLDHDIQKGH